MRNTIAWLFMAAILFAGCKKDNDRAFDQTPEERVAATLDELQQKLQTAQFGWKSIIIADKGDGDIYSFYFRFNNQNRVEMFSDFDNNTAGVVKESSYRLKALQQVSLLFDTYSYIHLLADPDPDVAGGEVGAGYGIDFEFYYDKEFSSTDSIKLIGRKKGNIAWLIRATQAEMNAYYAGGLASSRAFERINNYTNYFKRITLNNVEYNMQVNGREVTFTWIDGNGQQQSFTTSFYYTINGVVFLSPLVNGSTSITGLENVVWNANTTTLSFTTKGNNPGTVSVAGAGRPLMPDPLAWQKFYQQAAAQGAYWITAEGFHVNGVDDAYGIQNLTSLGLPYYYMIFFPEFGNGYDLLAPVYLDAAAGAIDFHYGNAASQSPAVFTDGRVRFSSLGTLSIPGSPYPTSGPFFNTAAQFYNAAGYYLIRTSATTFDMVSAADGKAWISWEL